MRGEEECVSGFWVFEFCGVLIGGCVGGGARGGEG